ncbi:MAG: hypothetical protein KIT09_25160 [Bryobacteraceae bacterium]|nr:hypothetical protein [Bryobacteraceae bacterium]
MTPHSILYPLSEFYEGLGRSLPAVRRLAPEETPEPYRRLLVHNRDMTPTLEAEHGRTIHLRPLMREAGNGSLSRMVTLMLDEEEKAVEMGAIRIFLSRLPAEARASVLEHRDPFGTILERHGVAHRSRPVAYFEVTPDATIREALGIAGAPVLLYGRRNTIWNSSNHTLAEVVEILPPVDGI